ncbi:hypothetical protein [Phytohabitans houttuyneae]|uniref:hypothetical protein n=1 Tax=Phytohabitans houttuyneae TaxID=1076126 RepID=UPI0031F0C7B5
MTRQPTAPSRAPRHPYSTRGLSLRLLLLGAMLTSLAIAMSGGQPVGAASDGREPASDSARLADGGPASAPGGPTGGSAAGAGSERDGEGGVVPAASASPLSPTGGSAGGPPDDWHRYNHWTDPSWPDPGQAAGERFDPEAQRPGGAAPLPARTAGGFGWEQPTTPTTEPTPSTGWTPTPGDPTDPPPGTPTDAPSTTDPPPDPTTPDEEPETPVPPPTSETPPGTSGAPGTPVETPGQGQPDGLDDPRTGALPAPTTTEPWPRDPVAAGPDDEDLGLGETVDEPTPTPEPSLTGGAAAPLRAQPVNPAPAAEYRETLVYSGLVGLVLAAIGLTMVGLRRRRW